jgi:metallo-beta-lactamase class B
MANDAMSSRTLGVWLMLAALCGAAYPQEQAPDKDAMYEHIMKARAAAGEDLKHHFYHRCFVDPNYADTIARLRKETAPMEPVKVFDNLYFIGQNAVSSWALQTSEGFIVFDSENNPDEAKQYIEGGMVKLGLDPHKIKYLIITHEHADHFGGANYLKEMFGTRIIASGPAWEGMKNPTRGAKFAPTRDIGVKDGEKFTLGDTTLTFYLTPGHADGALSTIFETSDHGVPHVVGFLGGLGSPHTAANRNALVKSLKRWRTIAAAAGVDTLIANHQGQDYAVENLEFLKIRHASDPNPFVIGKDAYLRYLDVQSECALAALARNGQKIEQ